MNSRTNSDKINASAAGVFYIIAAAAAIIGLKLYDPILIDANYLIEGANNSNQIVLGAFFELILACSAVGTGIILFPYLRKFNESMGLGYLCFRFLEVVFIIVGIISILSLLTLSHAYAKITTSDIAPFQTAGTILKAIHSWTFMLGPNFMLGINTFLYSYIFYQSELVPRKLSILGMVAAVLIFTAALLEMFGIILQISMWGILLAIPVFTYEMTLAMRLIIKGFNQEVLKQINN